jgi:hypothetical protein
MGWFGLGLGPSRRRKTRARVLIPTEAVSWAQIYQPHDIQDVDTIAQVVDNTAQPSSQGEETDSPDNADSPGVMESQLSILGTKGHGTDYVFPYQPKSVTLSNGLSPKGIQPPRDG